MRIFVLDVEILDHGKGRQTGGTDLRDGRKLPIWFSARDFYRRIFRKGRESDTGGSIIEYHMCIVFLECWYTTDELGELWAVKIDLIEGYNKTIELRGVDVGSRGPLNIR